MYLVHADVHLSENEGTAHYLNSSLNKAAIDQVKADVLAGRTKLLYVAPESLTKEDNVEFLKSVKISFYAIDEAHCISEWGHDFRPEYRRIRPIVNEIGPAPIIALTATATDKVRTAGDGTCDGHSLLHTTRDLTREFLVGILQIYAVQALFGAMDTFAECHRGEHVEGEHDVLENGQ